ATLIPSIVIPVAMVGTFIFLFALGYSINVLTMFGLILVIGSLVDDAIVVVENTQSLMEREKLSAREAAIKSMRQITGAIIATTLVTVSCYVPLAFYGGMVGNIYVQFAVTMCIALCLSTFTAMTLSPVLCSLILRPPADRPSRLFAPVNAVLDTARVGYRFFVGLFVRRILLTLVALGLAGYAIFTLYGRLPSSFLPLEDKGVILCNIVLPPGAAQNRADAACAAFLERVAPIDGIGSVMLITGRSMMSGSGENVAMGYIRLKPWDERTTTNLQLQAIVDTIHAATKDIADAAITCITPPAINGLGAVGGASFNLCTTGDIAPAELSEIAKAFTREIAALPETSRATTAYNADSPQLRLDIDRAKAETLGVSVSTLFTTLQNQLASYYVNDFTLNGNNYRVRLQANPVDRASLEEIRDILIPANSGAYVPLSALGTVKTEVGPQTVTRFNKMTSAEMNAQTAAGTSTSQLYEAIDALPLPPGFHIEWTGMSYQERQNQGQIIVLMALALLFAYFFLVAQYESWSIPVPVMLAVSFALLGALTGLAIAKEPLSIYAQLGLVMLIGLSSKNAILMVEFAKQERERGLSITEAAMSGATLRYRAILMTAWSTILGILPLVIATGAGSASRRAIGITTFSGMVMATVIGIIFTPALYAAVQRLREAAKSALGLHKP
ncbi:MAG: efflux RND transporter permease subunit, partial [Kiritimatiellaeota bacterium]|nr:efflux RND transporter permease subunit [Kiritimatiellota bacterium]